MSIDVGCGTGRDLQWLSDHGYPAIGCDPAEEMLAEAGRRYPRLDFRRDGLPELSSIDGESMDNVLCSGVLMHLCQAEIASAIQTFARILRPSGRLVVSVRSGREGAEREPDGRLFTHLSARRLRHTLLQARQGPGSGRYYLAHLRV